MDSKMNIWDKQQQNWIKEILSKSGTELKEISDKNGKSQSEAKPVKDSSPVIYFLLIYRAALKIKIKKIIVKIFSKINFSSSINLQQKSAKKWFITRCR